MGHASHMFCSHCLVRRDVSCSAEAHGAAKRNVTETLEAQIFSAQSRMRDRRVSLRAPLALEHISLPFIPVLGDMYGLSTGSHNNFRVIYFDSLLVWKLGVLRMLAQRVPFWLQMVCDGAGAVMGPVTESLDILNLRSFVLRRLYRFSPAISGYVPVGISCIHSWRAGCFPAGRDEAPRRDI